MESRLDGEVELSEDHIIFRVELEYCGTPACWFPADWDSDSDSITIPTIIGVSVGLVILIVCGFFIFRHWKKTKKGEKICGGSCSVPYMTLSSRAAVINGIVQMVAGAIAFISNIALSTFWLERWNNQSAMEELCPGAWCGAFFVAGGIVTLIAGCKRSFCCTIGALVLAVVNFIFDVTFFVFVIVVYEKMWLYFRCWDNWPRPEPLEDCSHEKYQITVFLMSASILAAFAELFSVIWAIVITSQALRRGGCSGGAEAVTTPEIHGNVKAHNNSLRFNWMSQLASTIVSAIATFIILFIVAYGIQSGDHDRRDFNNQKAAIPLWCAPVYLLTAYCGFRAWRFGENSSLISFMVLNICQLALCSTELIFSAFVIRNRDEDDMAIR